MSDAAVNVLDRLLLDRSFKSGVVLDELIPTKALAQDQLAELKELCEGLEAGIKTHTYDGDTPPNARTAIREAGHIVITNPDMLHAAILPHHTKWLKLFQNLKFVVIDEM